MNFPARPKHSIKKKNNGDPFRSVRDPGSLFCLVTPKACLPCRVPYKCAKPSNRPTAFPPKVVGWPDPKTKP